MKDRSDGPSYHGATSCAPPYRQVTLTMKSDHVGTERTVVGFVFKKDRERDVASW